MNHLLWHFASRKVAALILCGGNVNTLMHDGPYGYGLYLRPEPQPTDDDDDDVVGLQFELSEDVNLTYRGIGWEPVETIALPNNEMMIGDGIVDADGEQTVCVYNGNKVRLIAISC